MTSSEHRRPPKGAVLWGVIKWLPFLALPSAVVFLEVRWQHEVFANDFDIHKLGREVRELEQRIAELEGTEAHLKTIDALDVKAIELRLLEPAPGQIEAIGPLKAIQYEDDPASETAPPAAVSERDSSVPPASEPPPYTEDNGSDAL